MRCPVRMHKAEKYAVHRRYVKEADRTFLMQNFGCARKVYNLYVDFLYRYLEENGYTGGAPIPGIRYPEVSEFKKEYPYLKEADSLGLANAKIAFGKAVERYNREYDHVTYTKGAKRRSESGTEPLTFRGLAGMPKFHSRNRGDYSYTTNCQYPGEGKKLARPTVRLEGDRLYVPKRKEGIRLMVHRPLPEDAVIGNVTFMMEPDGSLYASIEYSYTVMMDMDLREAVRTGNAEYIDNLSILGLDYSQEDFYVDSEGRKANYPHCYVKSQGKLARLQRELARMEKGSSNYGKKLADIRKLHVKIRNQRKDYIRKEASYLAGTYDVVAVEDINLRAMGEGMRLGRKLHDNGFGMFRETLSRKLEEKGSMLVKVGRYYASTKTCGTCGRVNEEVGLDVREWDCPVCGAHHDRDINAAVNICHEGRRILMDEYSQWLQSDEEAREKAAARSEWRRRKRSVLDSSKKSSTGLMQQSEKTIIRK